MIAIYYVALALMAAGAFLWLRPRLTRPPAPAMLASIDDLEDVLDRAWSIWPHIARQPAIWAASMGLAACLALNWLFGGILGISTFLQMAFFAFFSMFDVSVPFITVSTDKNAMGREREGRPWHYWFVVGVSVGTTILVGITSLGTTGQRANRISQAHTAEISQLRSDIARLEQQVAADGEVTQTAAAYRSMAEAQRRKAEIESKNKFCGPKCRAYQMQASNYDDLAARAAAREARQAELSRKLARLNQLSGQAVLNSGFSVLAEMAGFRDDDGRAVIIVLILALVGLSAAMPFLWAYGVDGAQIDRAATWARARRRVYWAAKNIEHGGQWLRQRFTPEELAELENAELAAVDPEKARAALEQAQSEAEKLRDMIDNVKLPDFANPADKAAVAEVLSGLGTGMRIPIAAAHAIYKMRPNAWMTELQFAQVLPVAAADLPHVQIERGNIIVSAAA